MSRPGNDKPWRGPLPAARGCDCHLCRPDDSYDEQDRRTIDTVLEHGWQVIVVAEGAGCSDPDHEEHSSHDHGEPVPAFAYTVGLGHRCGHPELLMSGLDHRVMHRALNDVAQRVMNGRRLAPGDVLEDVLAGVPVAIEQVSDGARSGKPSPGRRGSIATRRTHWRSCGRTGTACSHGSRGHPRSSMSCNHVVGACPSNVPAGWLPIRPGASPSHPTTEHSHAPT